MMKVIKLLCVFLFFTVVNVNIAHAGLILASDGSIIEPSELSSTVGTVLDLDNGQLVGAFNVDVDGIGIFDVDFVDLAFNAISDFDIVATALNVNAFTSALLSDVFIDVGNFLFDDIPSLTLGCEASDLCKVNVPTSLSGSGSVVFFGSAENQSLASNQPDEISLGGITVGNDLSLAESAVFARFTLAPERIAPSATSFLQASFQFAPASQEVPEPSSFLMILLGLLIVVSYRRNRAI
jgi:hypothetical protein